MAKDILKNIVEKFRKEVKVIAKAIASNKGKAVIGLSLFVTVSLITIGALVAGSALSATAPVFTATIAPTNVAGGSTQGYILTITNSASNGSGDKMKSAVVSIPSGFTSITGLSAVATTTSWNAAVVGSDIQLSKGTSGADVPAGSPLVLTFTATAPGGIGNYAWKTTACKDESFPCPSSGNKIFDISGLQPTVTVFTPTPQTITVTTPAPASAVYNSTFGVAATASSSLPVAITTSGSCSGSGTSSATITMTSGTGTCTVHYNQAGGGSYAAAPEVTENTSAQPLAITVTVNPGQTKVYGALDPVLTYTSSDLSVSFSGALARAAGETVGSYAINQGTLTAGANYAITFVPDNFSITVRALTITANSFNKYLGNTYTFSGTELTTVGLVSPDSVTSATLASTGAASGAALGSYPITISGAVGSGLSNYSISYNPGTLTVVDKLVPVITWSNPADITYNTALGATQLNATASVAGTFTYTPAVGTVLTANPGQALHVDFVPDDAGTYSGNSADVSINVLKANPTIIVTPYSVTYDGNAHTATSTVTGVNSEALTGIDLSGTTHTIAGNYPSDPWTFTDVTGNYNNQVGTVSDSIGQANLTVTANDQTKTFGATFTFAGTEFITAGLVGGDTVTSATLASTGAASGAAVGTYEITIGSAVGTGLSNYTINYQSGTLTVNSKTNQTITFGALANKVYGDAAFVLSATASSSLPVTFAVTSGPATLGLDGVTVTITDVGHVVITASQAGDNSFNPAPDVLQAFDVEKATPTITWANPADITVGTALSATQLNATASVGGTFVYAPISGTVLSQGAGQTLSTSFTPTDAAHYNNATATATINVVAAPVIPPVVTGGGGGGGGGGFIPEPVLFITNVNATSITTNSLTLTWDTNLPSTSYVIYSADGEPRTLNMSDNAGTPPLFGYAHSTTEIDTTPKVLFHTVSVSGLTPLTTYYFRVISRGSLATSIEYKVTMPAVAGVQVAVGEVGGSTGGGTTGGTTGGAITGEETPSGEVTGGTTEGTTGGETTATPEITPVEGSQPVSQDSQGNTVNPFAAGLLGVAGQYFWPLLIILIILGLGYWLFLIFWRRRKKKHE